MAVSAKLRGIFFGRYLWVTNTVTGGVFLAVGDAIQQNIEKARGLKGPDEPLDKARTGNFESPAIFSDWSFTPSSIAGRMTIVGLGLGLPHHIWVISLTLMTFF